MSIWDTRLRYATRHGPAGCTPEVSHIFNNFFSFEKLLVFVLGPVSVGDLVSVALRSLQSLREEDKYPHRLMVSGLMENRFDGT